MSLRQRPTTQPFASRTTSDSPSEQPTAPSSTPPSATIPNSVSTNPNTATRTIPRKGIRLNKVLGRIVPLILLVYISYTYDLVVLRYAYQHLYIQQKRTLLPVLWLLPTHGLFFWSLRAYLRVFFAHSPPQSNTSRGGVLAWLRTRLGASFPDPDAAQLEEQRMLKKSLSTLAPNLDISIELCQADGQPSRCFRDQCSGRPKPFRTRHCGDCRTCRVGFDHHCAWFDNDVTSPSTLRSFIFFLLSIPPLYLLGLGPLLPSAWMTLKRIHTFAATDTAIQLKWWGKWYSWIGGPAFRWMVGFGIAANSWAGSEVGKLPHQSPRAPVLVAFGAVFVFVATALASSSLVHLKKGLLTVDVERAKAYRKLQRRLEKVQKEKDARVDVIKQRMEALAPTQHFKVRTTDIKSGETKQQIVVLSVDQGLLDHGSLWTNIRRFLTSDNQLKPAWTMSDTTLHKVLEKASILPPAQ
ncbi:uncharacterized protein UTRI_10636_B [Ustilago trichophora]|uniref:Palmitoyltransferase n=1 Tax=Ustilago trichophora TaxID=86804 RepID=A0A5C3E8Z6_9BASI|nr:uncharacterized protein UTRI_10636_B [Ustilago trichophora]